MARRTVEPADDDMTGMPLLDRARIILGPRLTEDPNGYRLDGKKVSAFQVIAAAKLKLGRV